MHEGLFSLMQMAKTIAALERLGRAGVPHLSLLTDPCYGGVPASFATVADVVLAEPGALIGFAGPRVIEQITKQKLPAGFQTAEFLLEHGMLDLIVPRAELRTTLCLLLAHYARARDQIAAGDVAVANGVLSDYGPTANGADPEAHAQLGEPVAAGVEASR